jgi:CRISPR type I-E-associated protein CasB/Cse2
MGDHAALRRMNPLDPGRAAVVVYDLMAEADVDLRDTDTLTRWCVLVHALALARGAHDSRTSIGSALTEIRFGEARLAQLLSANFALLSEIIPRLARRLHANQQPMDWFPLMHLLLAVDRHQDRTVEARLRIARSFVAATRSDRESRRTP